VQRLCGYHFPVLGQIVLDKGAKRLYSEKDCFGGHDMAPLTNVGSVVVVASAAEHSCVCCESEAREAKTSQRDGSACAHALSRAHHVSRRPESTCCSLSGHSHSATGQPIESML